jgi:hypothetical protein
MKPFARFTLYLALVLGLVLLWERTTSGAEPEPEATVSAAAKPSPAAPARAPRPPAPVAPPSVAPATPEPATAVAEESREPGNTDDDDHETRDKVQVGHDLTIDEDETVKDAVAIGADLTVLGTVRGNAVCIGGLLRLGPKASVRGDAVSVGGRMDLEDGARVRGQQVAVGGPPLGHLLGKHFLGKSSWQPGWQKVSHRLADLFSEIVFLFFVLFIALLVTVFMPRQLRNIDEHLTEAFPRAALLGVAALVIVPLVMLALVVTCIGIPLVPLVLLVVAVAALLGYIAFAHILGQRILGSKAPLLQIAIGLLLLQAPTLLAAVVALPGGVFHMVAAPLDFVGAIITFGACAIGLGAVVHSRWGKRTLAETLAQPTPPAAQE